MSVNPAKTRVTFDLRPGPGAPRLPRNTVVDACGAEFVPWCTPASKALIFARSCPPGINRLLNAELGLSFTEQYHRQHLQDQLYAPVCPRCQYLFSLQNTLSA